MTKPVHDSNESQTLAALEEELRRLPHPEPPSHLEAALISAIPIPASLPSRRTVSRIRWAPLAALSAAAAAACVLVGLEVWVIERPENGRVRTVHEHATADAVEPTPREGANPAALPQASWMAYYRAWSQSPDALDGLLTRDAAVLLRPERYQSDLDARRFFESMNPIKEEHNEKHSMRRGVSGALV